MDLRRVFHWLPCATLLLAPAVARAQGSGRSLDLDPSVRSSGMGGASNAVFWDETNPWSNPALLGEARGVAYEFGRTQLVPGLAPDVHFTTNVVKLGGGGLGVALSGKPVDIGGLRLNYDPAISEAFIGAPACELSLWDVWDAIKCPVLALRGSDSDLLRADDASRMTRRGPPCKVIAFPGVGHAPALMARNQIAAVNQFLAA